MPQIQNNRILWLDYAKCIAIFGIVMSHVFDHVLGFQVISWVFSFALQLFFIISGYLSKDNENFSETVSKSFKSLIIPYFSFHLLLIAFHLFSRSILDPTSLSSFFDTLCKALFGMVLGIKEDTSYAINLNTPLWFLPALFFCRIITQPIITTTKNKNYKLLFTIVICITLIYLIKDFGIKNSYFYIDNAIMAIPFYLFGFFLKNFDFSKTDKKSTELIISIALFFSSIILNNIAQSPSERIDMHGCSYGHNIILFYIVGIINPFFGFFLAKYLSHWNFRLLSYWGQNTIIILGIHFAMIKYLKMVEAYILSNIFHLQSFNIFAMYIGNTSISIIIMFLCIPFIYVIQRYFPFMLGKFNNK